MSYPRTWKYSISKYYELKYKSILSGISRYVFNVNAYLSFNITTFKNLISNKTIITHTTVLSGMSLKYRVSLGVARSKMICSNRLIVSAWINQ